jgi:prophage endopeptidase
MSLLNPGVWLGFLLALAASFGSGYYKGSSAEKNAQKLVIAQLNAEAREKEQALVAAVNTQTTQLVKANNEAKILSQKRNSAIDTGALKLRIPVKTSCPVSTTTDAAPASGSDTRTAEIQPEFAKAILAIGDEADTTVRKLNACLAIYNQTREMINERK